MSYRNGRKRSFSPDRRHGRDRDRSRSRERDSSNGGGGYGGNRGGNYSHRYGNGGKGRREGKGYGKGHGKGKGHNNGARGGGGGSGMRTHGSFNASNQSSQINVEDDSSFQLIELLSKGLDFKLAMEEAEGNENPMSTRVPAIAAALCEKVAEANEEESEMILNCILKCIGSLPVHTFLFGPLIAIMSMEAREFTQSVIKAAARGIVESMNRGEPRNAKCLLAFLAAVCSSGGLDVSNETVGFGPAVLQPLVNRVSGGSTQFERDQFALLILGVLPVCGRVVSQGAWDLDAALDVIAQHLSTRLTIFGSQKGSLSPLLTAMEDEDEDAVECTVSDSLTALWDVVAAMRSDWTIPQLKCWVWSDLVEELTEVPQTQIVLTTGEELPLTFIWHESQPSLLYPAAALFSSKCGEFGQALAELAPSTRLFLTDLVVDIMFAFKPIVKWNGIMQGTLATAAEQLLSVEHLVDNVRGDFVVVEAVITLAIVPPYLNAGQGLVSGGNSCFFGHLLLELCKNNVKCCEPIAIGFDVLWQLLDSLDHVTALRTAELLAHHLNNTKFRWPFWQRWMDSIDLEDDQSTEFRFLKHILAVAVNLNHSSHRFQLLLNDINAELPSQLLSLLPAPLAAQHPPPIENTEEYRLAASDIKDRITTQLGEATKRFLLGAEGLVGPVSKSTTELAEFIKLKSESRELTQHWALTALMDAILSVGSSEEQGFSQTISNTLSLVDANESVLKWLLTSPVSEEQQVDDSFTTSYTILLELIASVWGTSPLVFEVLVTGLMRRGLVPPDKLIKWVTSTKVAFLNDFSHTSILLITAAIDHIPSFCDRNFITNAVEYLGDCVVAALGPLLGQASQCDEDDEESELTLKELIDKVRCIVRQCISVRAPTGSRLLVAGTSLSVVTRVETASTPQACKQILSILTRPLPLY